MIVYRKYSFISRVLLGTIYTRVFFYCHSPLNYAFLFKTLIIYSTES